MKRFGFCLLDIDIDYSFRTITWDIEFFSQFYVYEILLKISCSPSKSADLSPTTAILPETCDTSIPSDHSPSGPSFSDHSHSSISTSSSPPQVFARFSLSAGLSQFSQSNSGHDS